MAVQLVVATDGRFRDVDVNVQVPDATVADLLEALGRPATGGLRVGGRLLQDYLTLAEAGLPDGTIVHLGPSAPAAAAALGHGPVLTVVAGLDSGGRHPLSPGRVVLGRDPACEITIDSPSVSARHCALEVDELGRVTVRDLGSRNGVTIDDQPAPGPTPLHPGEVMRLGAVQLTLLGREPDDRPAGAARGPDAGGNVPFNRPPRAAPPPEPAPLTLPKPPQPEPAKQPFSWISLLIPIAIGALMAAVLSPIYALFMLLSPVMLVGNWVEGRRRGSKVTRAEAARFGRELAAFHTELARVRAEATERAREALPDPAETLRRACAPSVRLWERRPGDPDVLRLYAGVGSVAWAPPVPAGPGERPTEVLEALARASQLDRVPVPLELAGGGVLGIAGDRAGALALARSLVCQAAVHHGPADLRIAVLTDPRHIALWDWAKWLPHTRDLDAGGVARLLAGDPDDADVLLRGLLEAERDRRAVREPGGSAGTGPVLLAVLDADGLTEGRNAPARAVLRGDAGPVAGVVLAPTTDRLPSVCTAVVQVLDTFGTANLVCPGRGERTDGLLAAGLSVVSARGCALGLAGFEDPEVQVAGASLPSRVDLTALLEGDVLDAAGISRCWAAGSGDGLRAPIGVTEDGVLALDLVHDGPHGLVGGTTGSGKSELLRSLVAGLAAVADPGHLNFVLVDYKGGSAFDECARLPHTVGMVTDLDAQLGERALRCLEAELRYRERLLREAGATDLPEYLRLPASTGTPLPRLVVVIDEFATMAAELPDFIDALVGIAQRGRSLGVHLLLATQRPSGAVKDNIRANTNLRIALRVQDAADSTDVVGIPLAARIGRGLPGRAYVRLGPSEVVPIQTALVTGVSDTDGGRVDATAFRFGRHPRPPRALGRSRAAEPSDLTRLVGAARAAFASAGMPEPRRPWPEPLPTELALDALYDAQPTTGTGDLEPAVLVALADDPDAQAQYPAGWDPRRGNLLLYGLAGSGTTTACASITLALASAASPDDVHLYLLDFGAGGLAPLAGLPHVGAVITAGEAERQQRLVRWLRAELDRRREPGGRRAEPMIVLVLDGYAAFHAEYDDPALDWVTDHLARIVADGPAVGIHTVATVDRVNAMPTALSSTVSQKWVFRLADPVDYSAFGLRHQEIGVPPPGRAVVVGTGQAIQVGLPSPTLAEAVARVMDRVTERVSERAPEVRRPPVTLATLPTEVDPSTLVDAVRLDEHLWSLPVGVTESTLAPALLRMYPAEHALIAGPPRSGRSGLLRAIAHVLAAAAPEVGLTVVCTRPSPLRSIEADRLVTRADGLEDALAEVAEAGGRQVVLVDDVEAADDPAGAVEKLLGRRLPEVHLIAAGRSDTLRTAFGHWTQQLRRCRAGVLLRPDVDLDGDLLGVRLPRRAPVPVTVARGWLVNDGGVEFVQVSTIR